MKAEDLEILRLDLLRVLEANRSEWGSNAHVIGVHLRPFGFQLELPELRRELQYLEDKGLACTPVKIMSPENKTWRITAAGRDYLAQHG